jgi:hypothetical protein
MVNMDDYYKEIRLSYPHELELRWRQRDPSLVPERFLKHAGPGISQSYHFGEFFVQKHLESKGYTVLNQNFNVVDKNSKCHESNKTIESALGSEKYSKLHEMIEEAKESGKVENPDICAIKYTENPPEVIFCEVKKGVDKIRSPQITFAKVCHGLGIQFYAYYLRPEAQVG